MKRFLFLTALLLTAIDSHAAEIQVTIKSFAFGPETVTVPAGTKVTWTNKDNEPHTVVSNEQKFQSEALDTSDTFSVTFDKAGSYAYFCSLHPHMTGKVVVTER